MAPPVQPLPLRAIRLVRDGVYAAGNPRDMRFTPRMALMEDAAVDDSAAAHHALQANLRHIDDTLAKLKELPDTPKRGQATLRLLELRAEIHRSRLPRPANGWPI